MAPRDLSAAALRFDEAWGDQPFAPVGREVLRSIVVDDRRTLEIRDVLRLADEDWNKALSVLVAMVSMSVIEPRFRLMDPSGELVELEAGAVALAQEQGYVVSPICCSRLRNWEELVIPYFAVVGTAATRQ